MEELDNPFFFSASDGPNIVLVSPPLQGSANYASWSNAMKIALEVKNKWCIIDGSIAAPDDEQPQAATWRRCNLMVCSWIYRSVISSIAQSIMHIHIAKEVWEDLRRRFSQCDAQKISILQNDINNLKQGNMSVNDYYTKCRTLWEEMNSLRPVPVCRCKPRCNCNCEVFAQILEERETDRVIRFLQGLNDEFSNLKSNVLVLDPLPEVYKIFVMAEKVERQNNFSNLNLNSLEINHANAVHQSQDITNEVVAAVNSYNGKRTGNTNRNAKCTFCGMNGHTIEKCFKKHGYPPGWVPGYRSKGKQADTINPSLSSSESSGSTLDRMERMERLIFNLQNQIGQASTDRSRTTAAVSLIPKFSEEDSTDEVLDSGQSWDDSWFS